MVAKLMLSALALLIGISLTACSVKMELGYHGRTGLDDRTITPEFVSGKAPQASARY